MEPSPAAAPPLVVDPVYPVLVCAGGWVTPVLLALGVSPGRLIHAPHPPFPEGTWSGLVMEVAGADRLTSVPDSSGQLPAAIVGARDHRSARALLADFLACVRVADRRRWPLLAATERLGASWGIPTDARLVVRTLARGGTLDEAAAELDWYVSDVRELLVIACARTGLSVDAMVDEVRALAGEARSSGIVDV